MRVISFVQALNLQQELVFKNYQMVVQIKKVFGTNMKRSVYFASLSIAAAVCNSCSQTDDITEIIDNGASNNVLTIVSPETDNTPDTRLGIQEGTKRTITWFSGDKIAVWRSEDDNKYGFNYQATDPNHENWATFVSDGEKQFPMVESEKIVVVYPYTEAVTYNKTNNQISVVIPTHQEAYPNSFDPKAAVCSGATASKTDRSVMLMHACGFLRLTLEHDAKYVEVRSKNTSAGKTYSVCGPIKVSPKSAGTAPEVDNQTNNYVRLVPQTEGGEVKAGSYLIAILPSTSYNGFEVTADYGDQGQRHGSYDFSQVTASTVYSLSPIPGPKSN